MADQSLLNGGSFREIQGVKVLTIKGTPRQMGYQHGFLLGLIIGSVFFSPVK